MKTYVKSAAADKNTAELLDIMENSVAKLYNEINKAFSSIRNALDDTTENIEAAYENIDDFDYTDEIENNLDWVETELHQLDSMTVTTIKTLYHEVEDFM